MVALSEIQQLPLHEKLIVMEALWDGITRQEDQMEITQWHKNILDDREELIRSGKAKFIDWETAKVEIKRAIREDSNS